jgi:hypothetical protein
MKMFLVLALAGAQMAMALACGTIATPLACTVNVGGNFAYTFDNFQFINTPGQGGGKTYAPDDVTINVGSGGGNIGFVTFTKTSGSTNTGTTFFANSGETTGVRFSYDLTLTALVPGTVVFTGQPIVNFNAQGLGNGSPSLQMIVTNPPNGESCNAVLSVQQDLCDLPPATTNFLRTGDLLTIFGGTGAANATVLSYSNVYDATFNADTSGGVPEPSTWLMFGAGLATLAFLRKRG